MARSWIKRADPRVALTATAVSPQRLTSWHRLLAGLFGFALYLGLGGMAAGALGMALTTGERIAADAVAAGVIACSAIVDGRGRRGRMGYLAMALVLAAYLAVCWGRIASGGAEVLNGLALVLGQGTVVYDLPFATVQGVGEGFFACACAALLAEACVQMTLRGGVVLATVLALLAAVAVLLGYAQPDVSAALLAVGALGCFISNVALSNEGAGARSFASVALTTVALAALTCGVAWGVVRAADIDVSAPKQAVAQALNRIRYGSADYAMPDGRLENLGAKPDTDRSALTVSGDVAGSGRYLRGFVGERYDGESWQGLDAQAVTDSRGLFYWLGQDGFGTEDQLSLAAEASDFTEKTDSSLTVAYQGARTAYAYLPYTYQGGSTGTCTTDLAVSTRDASQKQADLTLGSAVLQKAYRIQSAVAEAAPGSSGKLDAYLADEYSYRQFVYQNYLSIPADTGKALAQVAGPAERLDADAAKERAVQILDDTVTYNDQVSTANGPVDFASYFLTQSKTGYDVHYATAATLLLRYYGVPARYVEGYVIDVDDASAGSVELTERDAHAWCEYYLDGVGWLVFEPSPGYRDGAFYEPSDNVHTSENADLYANGSSATAWTPQGQTASDKSRPTKADNHRLVFSWWFVVGLIVGAAALWAVRTVLARRRLRLMIERFKTADPSAQVPEMFSYGLYLARHGLGCRFVNDPYVRQAQVAERAGACRAETFIAAAQANDRALFAAAQADEQDRQAELAFLAELWQGISKNAPAGKRFWLRWVRCVL